MIVRPPSGASADTVAPLALPLHSIEQEKLSEARRRVERLSRNEILSRYKSSLYAGKRLEALLMAEALTALEIPPCFRNLPTKDNSPSLVQKFDLFMHDIIWLRRHHRGHVNSVRYQRYRELFNPNEIKLLRAAEYIFYQGKRPAWKIVASLSLSDEQQWECAWLRSAPIRKKAAAIHMENTVVIKALRDELKKVRRTIAFTDEDAQNTLERRYRLWVCAEMANRSPARTAERYMQMTGQELSRDIAARQLSKIQQILSKKR